MNVIPNFDPGPESSAARHPDTGVPRYDGVFETSGAGQKF